MGALSAKLRSIEGGKVGFWCPGCDEMHAIPVGPVHNPGSNWGYNGNPNKPTFTPSILVRYPCSVPPVTPENLERWKASPWPQTKVTEICHSFVTDGRIQFLGDCTHALAGQTVDIPDFP